MAGHVGSRGSRVVPLLLTLGGALALALIGRYLARRGVLSLPFMRERGVLMEFTRGATAPRVWLCAHLDTKSQPVPTLLRAIGIAIAGLGFALTMVLGAGAAAGMAVPFAAWVAGTVLTLAGALPVMMSVVTNQSPGALDNASGVAAVAEAARRLQGRDVGVLITDAEELGLAGARAWATGERRREATILNCDGVDDQGENLVMYSGRRPAALIERIVGASARAGIPVWARRLPVGVLTDSVAFADAGCATVTFSRGSRRTLARVHRPADDLDHLAGTGIAEVATLLSAAATELLEGTDPWKR